MTSLWDFPPQYVNISFRDEHSVFESLWLLKQPLCLKNYNHRSQLFRHQSLWFTFIWIDQFYGKLPSETAKRSDERWVRRRPTCCWTRSSDGKHMKFCQSYKLVPVPLTHYNMIGELPKGLGGYFYVMDQNPNCQFINRVAYGKMHRVKQHIMPCFDANTKLGTCMYNLFVLA